MSHLLPLIKREEIAEKTVAIWLDTRGSDFKFKAGQNVDLNSLRTFSISSSPNDRDKLRIAFRTSDSDAKKDLFKMPLGTKVKVDGPFGSFILPKKSDRSIIMLAGGIGITPMLSMILDATERKLPHKITLVYKNRSLARAVFMDELKQLEIQNPNFSLRYTLHGTRFINAIYYISGKPGFVRTMRMELEQAGIDDMAIRTEEFDGY